MPACTRFRYYDITPQLPVRFSVTPFQLRIPHTPPTEKGNVDTGRGSVEYHTVNKHYALVHEPC